MYICICKGITEQDILEASKTTSSSIEIMKMLGVAGDCGRCLQVAIDKFNEINCNNPEAAKNPPRRLKSN